MRSKCAKSFAEASDSKLWRAAPWHHGRAGDTSQVIKAAWKASGFEVLSLKVHPGHIRATLTFLMPLTAPQLFAAPQVLITLDIRIKNAPHFHHCPLPPLCKRGKKNQPAQTPGRFVGIQMPSRGNRFAHPTRFYLVPYRKEQLGYMQNAPQTLRYPPKSGASISPKTARNAAALP